MTLTVNGQPAEPGCYVDGHWGQYGGVHLLDRAYGLLIVGSPQYVALTEIRKAWPRNDDGSLAGAYGSDKDFREGVGGVWGAVRSFGTSDGQTAMELADAVLDLLNEHTEGGYWEWYDGEVFLRSYICPECGRDATDPTKLAMYVGQPDYRGTGPCDYCCDADDPGCFA